MPSLDHLRSFRVFADHLNFTHAARELHLSQPALHEQVRKLGKELEVVLYVRKGRGLALTADGERVAGFAQEMVERSERFVASLHQEVPDRPLVLCAGEGAFLYLLGDAIRAATRGGTRVRALVRDAEATVAAVLCGDAHVGVAALDEPPPELEARPLRDVGLVVALPKDHRLGCRRRLAVRDLVSEPLIAPPRGRPLRLALEQAARAEDVPLEVVVEARGWPLTLRMVQLGLGVAVVNDFCRLPRGVRGVTLRGVPGPRYFALRRRGAWQPEDAERLFASLA